MTRIRFYGEGLPGFKRTKPLQGRLVVLEGTDGVGRSTQIALLREWVESQGYAVQSTGMKRSELAGKGIKEAMQGHTLGNLTSQSMGEKLLFSPITLILVVCCFVVSISKTEE